MIFDIELQTGPKKQSTEEQLLNFKREEPAGEHCYHGKSSPNKRLTYEKCFVHPLVDDKLNLNF